MRCLQCGSQLALLKKFTDGEFCSAEHRTLFYDTQQKLIVERLQASARKLKRYKTVTKQAEPVVAPPPPPPEPIPAPRAEEVLPPFAALAVVPVLDALVARNHPYGVTPGFAFAPPELMLVPPTFQQRKGKRLSRLGLPVPTYLIARFGKRQQHIEAKPAPVSDTAPMFPELSASAGFGSPEMRRAAMARRHSAKSHPVGGKSFADNAFTGEISGFGETISRPDFQAGSTRRDGDIQTHGRWIAQPIPEPSDSTPEGRQTEVTLATEHNSPTIPVLLTQPFEVQGLNAIPRAFRMRPRNPVADASIAEFCTIEPKLLAPEPVKLNAALVSPVPENEILGPAACARFFRARPRGPVVSSMILESERIEPHSGPLAGTGPSLPSLTAPESAELTPLLPGRFLRMRPRGPVLDRVADSTRGGSAEIEAFTPPVSRPDHGATVLGELAPRFLDRGFRMRPRGAVASEGLAAFEPIVPQSVQSPAQPAPKPSLPASIVGEYAPVFVERGFRPRPRGPVQSTAVAQFERTPSGEIASLASSPALGHLPAALVGACAPKPVRRFYRIGPKSPAESASFAATESIPSGILEPLLSAPALGALPRSLVGEFSPVRVERFFRARPRGPVEARNPVALERVSTGTAADLASAPLMGTLPVHLIGDCAPNALVRFFRARPRGPVEPLTPLAYETVPCGLPTSLATAPRMAGLPLAAIGQCAPNPLTRFFRARPRGPLDATLPDMEFIPAGSPSDLLSKPARQGLPPVIALECAPNPVVRFFRARPRGPVAGITAVISSAAGSTLHLETKPGAVSLASLPPIAAGTLQPAFAGNPLRMRPRGGVQARNLRVFDPIDAGFAAELESAPVLGSLPVSSIRTLAPDPLDKFYKMRPRGPVQATQLAAFQQISSGESVAAARSGQVPTLAFMEGASCQPVFLDRFYRMRPRGPLQPGVAVFEALNAGAPETLIPRTAIPSMPAVLMRQARTPSRDRGPRMRPPGGPRPSSGTRNFDSHDESEPDTLVSQASKGALPEGILSDWKGPTGWVQFSMPEARESAPAMTGIVLNPADSELFIQAPLFSAELIVDYRPSLVDVRMAYEENHKPSWFERIAAFWNEATWDVKWVTAAVPVLLGVLIHSSLTRMPLVLAPGKMDIAALASNPLPPLKSVVDARWSDLRNELVGRAAVDLQEDFTRGLRFWAGEPNWSNSWAYDIHGGVKPGALALYTPSIGMADYDLEFTGEIETKSLGWAFRATDTRNYYSVKLTTIKPGPMPTVALVRSAVIDGKEGPAVQTVLPFPVSRDQVYRVRMEVSGQFFTVYVQGHVVAFWSDERIRTGGIGFYSSKGEQSRLLAVRVTHQFDALGRLCASLALQDNSVKQTGVGRNESQK